MKTTNAPSYEFTPDDLAFAMAEYINRVNPGSIVDGAKIRTSFAIVDDKIHATLTVDPVDARAR